MRSPASISLSLAVVVALSLAGCGSEDDIGSAPVLTNFTYGPQTITAGQATTINGTFDFTDADADANTFWASVTDLAGTPDIAGPKPARDVFGKTAGPVDFHLLLNPTSAGTYTLELWMTDDAGHESNKLSGGVTAQ